MGEVAQSGCRREAFDGLADLRDRLLRRQTIGDELAGLTVAAVATPARDDEVPHPGEPGERLRSRACRLAESRHLREPSRDQRGLRVVAELEAVDRPRGERDHVLRRGAELDADDVGIDVGPEHGRIDRVLQLSREGAVIARDHDGRREPLADLLGHVRPGQDGDGATDDERGEPLAGLRVEPLREAEHGRVAGKAPRHFGEGAARHGHDDYVDVGRRGRERHRLGSAQVDVLEVARVPAVACDRIGLLGRMAGEHDFVFPVEEHVA